MVTRTETPLRRCAPIGVACSTGWSAAALVGAIRCALLAAVVRAIVPEAAAAQALQAISEIKVGQGAGGFSGVLHADDFFGVSTASLGDVNWDGIGDLAVGAYGDDDGGNERGAVWVLFLNGDGSVQAHQKVSSTTNPAPLALNDFDRFGHAVGPLGDFDGDGIGDVVVGGYFDDDGSADSGAVRLLLLQSDGTPKQVVKISGAQGGLVGRLSSGDSFGFAATAVGDVDGDGVTDLAVGAIGTDDGGSAKGAVWILLLNADGSVRGEQKISEGHGGLADTFEPFDSFGFSLAALGDLDGNGVPDVAAGVHDADDGGMNRGAILILFLASDGTVSGSQRISQTSGGFTGQLDDGDHFGTSLSSCGDLDGDGLPDLLAGADLDDDGGTSRGAVWVMCLNADGTVKSTSKISGTAGGFSGPLTNGDNFGRAIACLTPASETESARIAVGAHGDDSGGSSSGAVWMFSLMEAWADLGNSLAGSAGAPSLAGMGDLAPSSAVTLTTSNAAAASAYTLVIGIMTAGLPFKGGVLVPTPSLLLGPLLTDSEGMDAVGSSWPLGFPSGSVVYFQSWIVDPAGPQGFAASNAISGTTP